MKIPRTEHPTILYKTSILGRRHVDIAKEHGVHPRTISRIVKRGVLYNVSFRDDEPTYRERHLQPPNLKDVVDLVTLTVNGITCRLMIHDHKDHYYGPLCRNDPIAQYYMEPLDWASYHRACADMHKGRLGLDPPPEPDPPPPITDVRVFPPQLRSDRYVVTVMLPERGVLLRGIQCMPDPSGDGYYCFTPRVGPKSNKRRYELDSRSWSVVEHTINEYLVTMPLPKRQTKERT